MIHEDIKKEVEDISIDNLQQSYFIPKLFEKYHKN